MLCGAPNKDRAQLINYATREPVQGSTQVANDDWLWQLTIVDVELLTASVIFTAKICIDDPDTLPGVIQLKSSVTTEIEILESSTANRLDALLKIPTTKTAIAFPIGMMKVKYSFDVQLTRSGTPTSSPKRQTYFRQSDASFYVTRDITLSA